MKLLMLDKYKEQFAAVMRNHIVMCHTLLPADLSRPRNLTSLSGLVLTTRSTQVTNQRAESGFISVNMSSPIFIIIHMLFL